MADTDAIGLNWSPNEELGSSGLVRYSGFVLEEYLTELQGARGMRVFREMKDSDPIISAVLFVIERQMQSATFTVEEAGSDQESLRAQWLVQTALDDMSSTWTDTLSEIITMLPFGFAPMETVFKLRGGPDEQDPTRRSKYDDGMIGWRKISLRAQETLYRWQFDDTGGIQAFEQFAAPDFKLRVVPIDKMLLFRPTNRKNNPEGFSILRGAYRPWFFKKNIERIEAIGIERDLAGLPVIYCPPEILAQTATAADVAARNALQKIATNIRRDEQSGMLFPLAYDENGKEMYKLELLSTGGQRQIDTDAVIQRYDKRIAMTALADFILVGQDKNGSYALMDNKVNLFQMAIDGWLDSITNVFNLYGIPRLCQLNGIPAKCFPTLRHSKVATPDLKEVAALITAAGTAGVVFEGDELEVYTRERLGMAAQAQDDRGVGR